jgi:hypothetical protein
MLLLAKLICVLSSVGFVLHTLPGFVAHGQVLIGLAFDSAPFAFMIFSHAEPWAWA